MKLNFRHCGGLEKVVKWNVIVTVTLVVFVYLVEHWAAVRTEFNYNSLWSYATLEMMLFQSTELTAQRKWQDNTTLVTRLFYTNIASSQVQGPVLLIQDYARAWMRSSLKQRIWWCHQPALGCIDQFYKNCIRNLRSWEMIFHSDESQLSSITNHNHVKTIFPRLTLKTMSADSGDSCL